MAQGILLAADDGNNPANDPRGGASSSGRSAFVPRWRKHTAEVQPVETPAVDPKPAQSSNLHPNLQSEHKPKKFEPRWRQRAQEAAAMEQERQQQNPVVPSSERPGFQPRWRRTAAAPSPSSETPLEPQAHRAKPFQAKWRERTERPENAAPPPKASFTPRWKRNVADPPAEVEAFAEAPPTAAVGPDDEGTYDMGRLPDLSNYNPGLDLVGDSEVESPLAAEPLQALAAEPLQALAAEPLQAAPASDSVELAEESGLTDPANWPEVSQSPLEWPEAEPVPLSPEPVSGRPGLAEPAATPTPVSTEESQTVVPEEPVKKRLPRPQAPPPPKPAAPITPGIPVPNTEDDRYSPPAPPEVKPSPVAAESRFLPGPETIVDKPRVPKRLDEEAMAALKATASVLTGGNRPAPPPAPVAEPPQPQPPPPEPPRPQPQPRYQPTPRPRPPSPPEKPTVTPVKSKPPKKQPREHAINQEEVATFTRQFAVMIGAGLPIHQALSFFAESTTGTLGKVIDDVATRISSGMRLSVAMAQHPIVFSEVYLGLVELGETTSHIDEALEKLADLLEKQVRLAKRLTSALVYPAFLVAVSMGAVGIFLQYVLPTMIPLFQSFSLTLPWPTRVLLASRYMVWPTVILAVLSFFGWRAFRPVLNKARRRKAGWAQRIDAGLLRLPVFGKFIGQVTTARVLFAMATMIETGLPIMNALRRCESVASNLEYAQRLARAGEELRDGSTVTEALALHNVLPSSCLHLISAGEESAQMVEMVQYSARFYEEEVDQAINNFMSLVEPVIMCVMGVVVGFIVLSAVLPTVEMINHLA